MLDNPWIQFAIVFVVCIAGAVVFAVAVSIAARLLARRRAWPPSLIEKARRPFRALVLLVGVWISVAVGFPGAAQMPAVAQTLTILAIIASAWLLAAFVSFATDLTIGRHRVDVRDNRVARRVRTQALIMRRLAIALLTILAIGAILLTFPTVRTFGASILASAGIASIVAGLAAQSVLANIFAGLQLVFSDALRIDDVVVVDAEWGRVGEITLSYVVLDLWDDRRLVLPCTYFTSQPFQNWTRQGSELLGAVEFDVDWRVSPARMREQLGRIVAGTELWDGRTSVLQVTDAVGGMVRVRVLVTAQDSPTLFDLRCYVRESMVTWIQQTMPTAVPVQRVLMTDPVTRAAREAEAEAPDGAGGLFTGSVEAEARAGNFTQAVPVLVADETAGDGRR